MEKSLGQRIIRYKAIYMMILPAILYYAFFIYAPFYGLQIAFKDFNVFAGISGSEWVGFEKFQEIFTSERFYIVFGNTLLISLYKIIWGFPVPIIFALMLNEVRVVWFKKSIQTITYFPHFLSWVVFAGIVFRFFGPTGIVNALLTRAGFPATDYLTSPAYFRSVLVITEMLKNFGWSAIIYLASITSVDPQLYEAAQVDGAGKLRQIWHITISGIRGIILLQLMLSVSNVLNAGFDQVFMLYNPAVYDVGDIIDTYVYRVGLQQTDYSTATAVGLFKSVIGMTLIVSCNALIRKYEGRSLW